MAHYRALGRLPRQRHTQMRDEDGHLFREELMGEEGFPRVGPARARWRAAAWSWATTTSGSAMS